MQTAIRIVKLIVAIVIIATIAGLAWWFFFLRSQTSGISALDAARGLNDVVPSFTDAIGSTYKNIISNFTGSSATSTNSEAKKTAKLRQVDSSPVAGMGFVGTSTNATLLYVQNSTGYLISTPLDQDVITRVTNTLIPKTREALITANGSAILRGIDGNDAITTFVGTVATSSMSTTTITTGENGPKPFVGKEMPKNILSIVLNQKTRDITYLTADQKGGSTITQVGWGGGKAKILFTSPLQGWNMMQLADARIILTQKPSDSIPGYVYQLNTRDGTLTPLVRDIPGLTALPQASTSAIIFSASANGEIALYVASSSKAVPSRLSIKTVTEKCVWAPGKELIVYCAVPHSITSNAFLDLWHQGFIHTNDSWWKIDFTTGSTTALMDAHDTPLDVQKPIIDPTGEYIAFINGADESLWLLRIKE